MNKDIRPYKTNFKSPFGGDLGGLYGAIIIADDITGAAEMAGVCLRYNLKVSFGIDDLPANAEVRIIATDSRSMVEEDAYQVHRKIALKIKESDFQGLIFKKCDSVLRGYILTEIYALSVVFKKEQVLLQPSNPATGRCIKNGTYFIGDSLLHETGFSVDPNFPAFTSSVTELIHSRSSVTLNPDFPEILLNDCTSKDELKKISEAVSDNMLTCGSAAFFEQILITKFNMRKNKQVSEIKKLKNYLFISGSTHPSGNIFRTEMQGLGCPVIQFPETLFSDKLNEKEIENFCIKLINEFEKHAGKLIVFVHYKGNTLHCSPESITKAISAVAKKLIPELMVNDVFIDGGATAFDIFKTMEIKNLIPLSELAPGVVKLGLPENDNLNFTIKPGSYNWPMEYFSE